MSSGGKRSKYHSFFSKRRQSRSPVNDGGRKNDPKKQHLSINAPRKDLSEDVKEEQLEDVNISGENLSDEVVALIASNHKKKWQYLCRCCQQKEDHLQVSDLRSKRPRKEGPNY